MQASRGCWRIDNRWLLWNYTGAHCSDTSCGRLHEGLRDISTMDSTDGKIAAFSKIRFGTSSFSSKDWIGPFYEPGTPASEFLKEYARQFNTVEIDSTYYAIPSKDTVKGWVEKTPDDFILSAKFPKGIVHCGEDWQPNAELILQPDSTYAIRDRFLDIISETGSRLGTLILQFPYFSKRVFSSRKPFMVRLFRFLDDLPKGFSYGVEIRNRNWLNGAFAEELRKRAVSLVLLDHAWMPHADEIAEKFDVVTSDTVYIRLIGDRKEIEALTKTWDREVIDRSDRLERWADFLVTILGTRPQLFVDSRVWLVGAFLAEQRSAQRRFRNNGFLRLFASHEKPEKELHAA
jgi:uncharacterized protein YecE (DUF72 family)